MHSGNTRYTLYKQHNTNNKKYQLFVFFFCDDSADFWRRIPQIRPTIFEFCWIRRISVFLILLDVKMIYGFRGAELKFAASYQKIPCVWICAWHCSVNSMFNGGRPKSSAFSKTFDLTKKNRFILFLGKFVGNFRQFNSIFMRNWITD